MRRLMQFVFQLVVEFGGNRFYYFHGLINDFRSDPVAGKNG